MSSWLTMCATVNHLYAIYLSSYSNIYIHKRPNIFATRHIMLLQSVKYQNDSQIYKLLYNKARVDYFFFSYSIWHRYKYIHIKIFVHYILFSFLVHFPICNSHNIPAVFKCIYTCSSEPKLNSYSYDHITRINFTTFSASHFHF